MRSRLSRIDIQREINRLNRLNPTDADYEHLKRTYHKLTWHVSAIIGCTPSTELLFRARRIAGGDQPTHASQLGAAPSEYIQGFGRCNPPNVSVFYGASKRIVALNEIRASPGDTIYLSEWMVNRPIPINRLLEPEKYASWGDDKDNLLRTYFDTIFTRRVGDTFSDDYKFTAALFEVLTTSFKPSLVYNIKSDGIVALRYPPTTDFRDAYNTAMFKTLADSELSLTHVMKLHIIDVGRNTVDVKIVDNGIGLIDGRIE